MNTIKVEGVVCPCEGTPHPDGDTVELRERLDLPGGVRLQQLVIEANNALAMASENGSGAGSTAELAGLLAAAYMEVGVVGWTFVDAHGKALPVTPGNIQRMLVDDFVTGQPVAERADDLYLGPVLGPLVKRVASSSPTTRTAVSTSATSNGSPKSRKRSGPSSTSTTQTDDTTTTSP